MKKSGEVVSAIDRLFESPPFTKAQENLDLFRQSFCEAALVHYERNQYFQRVWKSLGIHPSDIASEADFERVPWMMVSLFKDADKGEDLVSVPQDEIVLELTSSGTSGQKSRMVLDQKSLQRVKRSAWMIHEQLGMISQMPANYLCFTYDPRVAINLGTAFTDELLTSFTKRGRVFYALQWSETLGDFSLNKEGVIQTLKEYCLEGVPVRILGFPAHMYRLFSDYQVSLKLPDNSWIMTGGGWKGFSDQEISKTDFKRSMEMFVGVPPARNRDMFGMVEHGIPYCDCERGNLHIPNYARVIIRDPFTQQALPDGETGLIQLICSYVTSYPSLSILTTDWGRIGFCDCAIGGRTLEIVGRAGMVKHKGCALAATKYLEPRVSSQR